MKKINKKVKCAFAVILTVVTVLGVLGIVLYSLLPPDKEKMEKYYQSNKDDFNLVADYLADSDYSFISIDKIGIEDGVMFTGAHTRHQEIDDNQVLKALKRLLNNGKYEIIGKSHNTVYFQKWSFGEKDRGIAVSVNENEKIWVEFLIKSEPLHDFGWYYYEADYEKDRNLPKY